MAVLIAMVSLILWGAVLFHRRRSYRALAQLYASSEAMYRTPRHSWNGRATSAELDAACRELAEQMARIRRKYEDAADHPWRSVAPAPPFERDRSVTPSGVFIHFTTDEWILIKRSGVWTEYNSWSREQRSIYLLARRRPRPISEIARELLTDSESLRGVMGPMAGRLVWDRSKADPEIRVSD